MLEYLHVLTLFSWIPLALLASAQNARGHAARFLWWLCGGTFLLCGYILYLDFVWSKTVVAPIRVDLLLVIPLTTITFTGVGLWGLRRPGARARAASLLLLALSLPTLLVFAERMWRASSDMARMDTKPALIYEAQFRNPDTFRNFFGNIDKQDDPRVGHFRAEDPGRWASRVIINDEGHFWLLFKCYATVECVYAEAELGEAPLAGTFKAKPRSAAPYDVAVSAWSQDRFTLTVAPTRGAATFVRAPVSYRETASAPGNVVYHGAFSEARIEHGSVSLVQIWLWQSGDRWLAYYVRRGSACGVTNDFMSASAYEGRLVSGQIYFTIAGGDRSIEDFQIPPPAPGSDRIDGQIFYGRRPLHTIALERRAVFRSPIYESAPLTDLDATTEWLKTVSMGYMMSWKAECSGGN